jgi:hypothetical protein
MVASFRKSWERNFGLINLLAVVFGTPGRGLDKARVNLNPVFLKTSCDLRKLSHLQNTEDMYSLRSHRDCLEYLVVPHNLM